MDWKQVTDFYLTFILSNRHPPRSLGGALRQGGVRQRADDDVVGRERRLRLGVGRGAKARGEAEGEEGAAGAAREGEEGEGRKYSNFISCGFSGSKRTDLLTHNL